MKNKRFPQAIEVLNNGLKKCGENGDFYFLQGEAYKNLNDIEKAKDALSLALKNYNSLTFDVAFVKDKLNNIHS